jgi:hypothetical protein
VANTLKFEELDVTVQEFLASLPRSREPYVIQLADRNVYIWVCDNDEPFPGEANFASEEFPEPYVVTKPGERE